MDTKKLQLRKLQIILILIKSNNFHFPDGEEKVAFETLLEMYYNDLDYKYRVIVKKFNENPNRWGRYFEKTHFNGGDYYSDKELTATFEKLKKGRYIHFNGGDYYSDKELTATFEKLKKGRYIHSESDLDSWIYLCTGRREKAFTKPINWTKSGVLLGMFVQDLFSSTDNTAIWEITAKCFTVKGKTPNTNSIKVSLSKIKKNWEIRPKDYDKMKDEIINDIT